MILSMRLKESSDFHSRPPSWKSNTSALTKEHLFGPWNMQGADLTEFGCLDGMFGVSKNFAPGSSANVSRNMPRSSISGSHNASVRGLDSLSIIPVSTSNKPDNGSPTDANTKKTETNILLCELKR